MPKKDASSLVEHVARALYRGFGPWEKASRDAVESYTDDAEVVVAAIFDPDTGWLTQPDWHEIIYEALTAHDLVEWDRAAGEQVCGCRARFADRASWYRHRESAILAALAAAVRVSGDDT